MATEKTQLQKMQGQLKASMSEENQCRRFEYMLMDIMCAGKLVSRPKHMTYFFNGNHHISTKEGHRGRINDIADQILAREF